MSVAPSAPTRVSSWVGPGVVKLVYSQQISQSLALQNGLAQLVLAEAGVTEEAAPWLWSGLPMVLRDQATWLDRLPGNAGDLSTLQTLLEQSSPPENEVTGWAAVDYVRQRIGWSGLGQLVTDLGQLCRQGLCQDSQGVDRTLQNAIRMDNAAFESAWQTHWRDRLGTIMAELETLLGLRAEAILNGDTAALLATVDPSVHGLTAEQSSWLAGAGPLADASYSAELSLLLGEDVLTQVTLTYQPKNQAGPPRTVTSPIRFTSSGDEYRWAGAPFESLRGDDFSVWYPAALGDMAPTVLEMARSMDGQLAPEVGWERPAAMVIKLYADASDYANSISLGGDPATTPPAWSGEGGSIKLLVRRGSTSEALRPALALHLARTLLAQMEVEPEWLLRGTSILLAGRVDGGFAPQAAAASLLDLLRAAGKDELEPLASIAEGDPPGLADVQAWDAVRYLVYTHGWEALLQLLHSSQPLTGALLDATGQSLPAFEAAWTTSIGEGHTRSEWVAVANAFDPERAAVHIAALTSADMAGRQAGSAGAEAAADYIAQRFAEYGLQPIGGNSSTFLHHFPITYTTLVSAPQLLLGGAGGELAVALAYREDFLYLGGSGSAQGELVWIQDSSYQDMELEGKIVVRREASSVEAEAVRAYERGAVGFILVGSKEKPAEMLAKTPLPGTSSFPPIPILELTQAGYNQLLEAAGQTRESLQAAAPALPLGLTAEMEVEISQPRATMTANVLGLLPGSDPILSQEVVILGAHYDHVGDDPDAWHCAENAPCQRVPGRRYSGANDDASGVAVLLEIARMWQEANYQPRRSVLFAAWGAQELGELGSTYYVAHPALPLESTVAMIQLDAVAGGDGYYLEARGGWEQDGLLLYSMMATEALVDGRLAPRGQPGKSDQLPFHQAGIPALFVSWRDASEDNWPDDIADEVEPFRLGVTGRMVTLTLMSVAQ